MIMTSSSKDTFIAVHTVGRSIKLANQGRIVLFGNRREYHAKISGVLWGQVVDETGPGLGLILSPEHPSAPGRILFIGSTFIKAHRGYVWYSDDGGEHYILANTSWVGTNEAQMAELADGTLIANLRLQGWPRGSQPCYCRAVARSTDAGERWIVPHREVLLLLEMRLRLCFSATPKINSEAPALPPPQPHPFAPISGIF